MNSLVIGYAMLIGGPVVVIVNAVEWYRWRTGRPPLLGGKKAPVSLGRDPKSGMGRTIESMELIIWTAIGLFVGFMGLGIVTGF